MQVMACSPMPAGTSGLMIGGYGSTRSCAPAPKAAARISSCAMPSPAPSPVPPSLSRANSSTGFLAASSATASQMPTLVLPAGTEVIGLVGEGLANAVFSFSLPRVGLRIEERSAFRGKLLRLQKAPRDGRASQYPYTEVQRYWENEIRPLFRDPDACLVRQQLVVVRRDVATACNRLLAAAEAEDERDEKFTGDWVCDGPQLAMIVDDMRPPPRSLDMMGEFKPKWLTQSPSAPAGSVRCRTCATYLRRFILKPSGSSLSGFQRACRLRLCDENPSPPSTPVTEEPPSVPSPTPPTTTTKTTIKSRSGAPPLKRAATFPALIPRAPPASLSNTADTPIWSKEALLSSIRAHPLMRELRTIQDRLDTCGPLAVGPDDADFQKAMTLRDCTCYVYVSRSRAGATCISVRLGDLDRKDGSTKSEYWRRTEQTLIESGFYTARSIRVVVDEGEEGVEFEVPVKCVLSHVPLSDRPAAGPVMEVRGVGRERLGHGHGILALGTTWDGSGDAVLGIKEVDTLRKELEELQHNSSSNNSSNNQGGGVDESNHRKRKLDT